MQTRGGSESRLRILFKAVTILLGIVGAIVLAIVGVLAIAATKPPSFTIQRSTRIAAPPEAIFPLLDDFHAWTRWSPWEKLDPAMTRSHSGAPSGKGAVYEWEGNDKVGKGRMEISESVPPTKLVLDLHFITPWQARNVTEFTLEPKLDGTHVVWAMSGQHNFTAKVMAVFMNMDTLVGKDFEKGLATLKQVAETA